MRILRRLRSAAVSVCAVIGFILLFVTFTPFVHWYAGLLAKPWMEPRGDVLIVLGGGVLSDSVPTENTIWRCFYALRAYREGGFRKIVVTGARVAPVMRAFLVNNGIPAGAVVTEGAANSTRENALFTARLLTGESGSKVLLTSDYHMFRAARAFRKAGLDIQPRPFPDAGKRSRALLLRWPAFLDETTETLKIAYYASKGWI